jgi:hypothetical protein
MNRHNTRPNNKDKHPGMVDLSLQRRTQTQRKVENKISAEDKQAREEARKAGVKILVGIFCTTCATQGYQGSMVQWVSRRKQATSGSMGSV